MAERLAKRCSKMVFFFFSFLFWNGVDVVEFAVCPGYFEIVAIR